MLTLLTGTQPPKMYARLKKEGLNTFIDQRKAGYNVIKFEFDFFTGPLNTSLKTRMFHEISLGYNLENYVGDFALVNFWYNPLERQMNISYLDNKNYISLDNSTLNTPPATLPFNTWFTFIVYLDYDNKKIYFETPYFNTVAVGNYFLSQKTSTNLIEDFKPRIIGYSFTNWDSMSVYEMENKLDNIKLTALKSVPLHVLSAETVLAGKFNLFPNPATNVVNITNNENMLIKEVAVYNVTGKLITTQNYNNEAKPQLNVENLASGTYMLHLQTNEGVVVKKLVKK